MRFESYISRWNFIIEKCRGKSVLHLGCIGITEGSTAEKIDAMRQGGVLHTHLKELTLELVGVDYDMATIKELNKLGFTEIVYGNVENLDEIDIHKQFDIILCGDLIEHLSKPGAMLDGLRPFLHRETKLLITTPNAFGLLHFLRFACGRFREGNDHVISFSTFTLHHLLRRHGFDICEVYSCYNRPPQHWLDHVRYGIGIPFFKLFPRFGGTLLAVAKFLPEESSIKAAQ
jgi:hypothetical protein